MVVIDVLVGIREGTFAEFSRDRKRNERMNNKVQHVTTEATSVRHKRHMLLACFGAVLSCFWFVFSFALNLSEPTADGGKRIALSTIPILCCVVWLCAIKVRLWWNHG